MLATLVLTTLLRKYLDFPPSMKVHPVFHFGLLKDSISSSPESEVSDNIPCTNDLFLVTILFSFTQLLITKLPHTLLLMRKVLPFYSRSNGKDMTLPKTLGNPMLMLNKPIVCMTILKKVINSDFLYFLVNIRS